MALKIEAVGHQTEPIEHEYDWKDVVLYALGVGARVDLELDLLYEKRGPRVLPTYAVVPVWPALHQLVDAVGGDFLGVVHMGQSIRLHRPFESSGRLTSVGEVAGVYDLKRMATAIFRTTTHDADGQLVSETEMSILFRFDGGFGGPKPPREPRQVIPERAPDFRFEDETQPEQAALYRLSGDLNPLHIDPETAVKAGFDKPILHGLCTYGHVGRAVVRGACGGDPSRLTALRGQFRKPVLPGETLITEGWVEGSEVIVRTATSERPDEYVFSGATAEIR